MSYHQLAEFSSQNEGVRLSQVDQTKLFNGSTSQGEIKLSKRTAWSLGIGISAMIIFLSFGLTFAIYDIVQLKNQQNHNQESKIQTFEDLINSFPGAYDNLLDFAIVNGNIEWVKFLLKNNPNETRESIQNSLHMAISMEDKEIVKHLLHNGANINAKDEESMTPLHFAEAQMAQFLIKNGANIQAKDRKSWTPLFYAVLKTKSETAQLLIDHVPL